MWRNLVAVTNGSPCKSHTTRSRRVVAAEEQPSNLFKIIEVDCTPSPVTECKLPIGLRAQNPKPKTKQLNQVSRQH